MNNFSTIKNKINLTNRDKIINNFVSESGLPKEEVVRLYESSSFLGLSQPEIYKRLSELLTTKNVMNAIRFFRTFVEKSIELTKEFKPGNDKLIKYDLERTLELCISNKSIDATSLLKIVVNILLLKDANKFFEIANESGLTLESDLSESVNIDDDFKMLNDFKSCIKLIDKVDLYESMRDVLVNNSKLLNFTDITINNLYQQIISDIDNDITNIQETNSIISKSNELHDQIINTLFNGGQLDSRYKFVDLLKVDIADIQLLTADLCLYIGGFIKQPLTTNVNSYMDPKYLKEFEAALTNYLLCISSSISSSRLLHILNITNNFESPSENISVKKLFEYIVDKKLRDNYLNSIDQAGLSIEYFNYMTIVDILTLLKTCGQELNMVSRNKLSLVITKGFEFITRYEKVYLKLKHVR